MDEIDLSDVPTDVVAVSERVQRAGWDFEWIADPSSDQPPRLVIWVPNGREKRREGVGRLRAQMLLNIPLEQYRLLGNYQAINNSSTSYIEAAFRYPDRSFSRRNTLQEVPGVELIENSEVAASESNEAGTDSSEEPTGSGSEVSSSRTNHSWRLRIKDDKHPWYVEFSSMSDDYIALSPDTILSARMVENRPPTLKIIGVETPRHDDAVRKLEEISGAVFFELDLRYGVTLELNRARSRLAPKSPRRALTTNPPIFPRLRYPPEALSLYSYGRSASELPLLQFLAYYQILEYFFPMYFREDVIRRMRQEISDPRFDASDDGYLVRLLTTITAGGRAGYGSEREQLRATVSRSVDETTLREFLNEDPERLRILSDRNTINNVPIINEANRNNSLTDQIAERIYAIRCRVVHSKADGGEMAVDLLLPGSREAAALATDISVLQFIAQKAIIAGGTTLS